MAKNKVYWVKVKPFEPGKPMVKFKPAFMKGLVFAPNAEAAKQNVYDEIIIDLRKQFPDADLKQVECKSLSVDFVRTVVKK